MDATPMIAKMLEHGILGVLLCLSLWWIYKLYTQNNLLQSQYTKDLKEVQDKRTEDAKLVVDKLLQINEKWNDALSEQMRVIEQMDPVLKEIKTLLLQNQMNRSGRN